MSALAVALSRRANRQYKNKHVLKKIMDKTDDKQINPVKESKQNTIISKIKYIINRFC